VPGDWALPFKVASKKISKELVFRRLFSPFILSVLGAKLMVLFGSTEPSSLNLKITQTSYIVLGWKGLLEAIKPNPLAVSMDILNKIRCSKEISPTWRLKSPNVVKKSVGLFSRQVSFILKPSKQASNQRVSFPTHSSLVTVFSHNHPDATGSFPA